MDQVFGDCLPPTLAGVLVVFGLCLLPGQARRERPILWLVLAMGLSYIPMLVVLYDVREGLGESYAYLICAYAIGAVLAAVGGLLLGVWLVLYTGLWDRRFRSSLQTLLALVLFLGSVGLLLSAPPCEWLALAWDPEFWLCVLLAGVLLVSLLRDKHRLR
jgi:drug/metabolite transporter (DMT)-like permease